jgi:hypothetical protein
VVGGREVGEEDKNVFSKRELEGYLEIDHRESPGITPELAAKVGHGTVPVGPGQIFKAATYNCSHCEALVVINPDRTRVRGYCPKCDRYVCDLCEAERVRTGMCRPFKQVIDEFIDNAAKGALDG